MKRRDFLKLSSMATLATTVSGLPIHAYGDNKLFGALARNRGVSDKILVLIQMSGGNDGLNTVIPLDRYSELSAARSNILINQTSVLPLSGFSSTGFHPSMTAMQNIFNTGRMNIIQGVSYPDPNFSHFRATDIFFSAADSNTYLNTGWVGRYLDQRFPGAPQSYPDPNFLDPLAIQIGSTVSSVLTGANGLNGLAVSSISNFYQIISGTVDPAPATPAGNELTFLRFIAQQTQAYTLVLQNAAALGTNLATYPTGNRLADQLKIVARLINGGLQTPIYIVNQGGYDTHDNQVEMADHSIGDHADKLKELSDAIGVFQQDLKLMGKEDKVAGCTFSEFGRRIKSNASGGTDHGSAAPMIVFGTQVNPTIIGTSPILPASATVNDNVPMQYDFRQVYASILQDWFKLTPSEVSTVLNGQSYQTLPIFKWTVGTTDIETSSKSFSLEQNFPNPFSEHTIIRFTSEGGMAQIVLYDQMGKMIRVLYENDVPAGTIDVGVDRNNLPAGTYYYQLHVGSSKMGKAMVVVN
ncbi:MAG TPA: DUF1501 domain-containing protein [Chitinophagaceae bacterium]|nr:DUF1501 domain-containing protein [Chitinophagaceae bacterium]